MQAVAQPELAPAAPPRPKARMRQWITAAVAVWLLTGVYIVNTQQQAVVTRFAAVVESRVMPGIHTALPWPMERVARLKEQPLQRRAGGGDDFPTVESRAQPLRSRFPTADQS